MAGSASQALDLLHFHRHGVLALQGVVPGRGLQAIRQRIREELARLHGGARAGTARTALARLPAFQQTGRLSALVQVPQLQQALLTPDLHAAVHTLAGRPPGLASSTQLLLSLPRPEPWSLSGLNWHVDLTAPADGPVPGVQAFFLIDDVASHGGATLALAGSHRLPPLSLRALRAALKADVDLQALQRQWDVQVTEMCGRAGTVFLMDMRELHTPSINATRAVRMMATTRFLLDAPG